MSGDVSDLLIPSNTLRKVLAENHPYSYDESGFQSKTLIVDVKTGHILNWKPFTTEELDAIIEEWEGLRQDAIMCGDCDDF